MGTDIHVVIQVKKTHGWVICENLQIDRNYWLFAALAGVRNGHGFAGIPTGNEIIPISAPRGLPDDFILMEGYPRVFFEHWYYGSKEYEVYMGEHSYSWLLLSELLLYNWDQTIQRNGLVHKEIYATLRENEEPAEWCGWTNSPDYISYVWSQPLKEIVGNDLLDKLKLYLFYNSCDSVRMVFGFDS